MKLPLPLKLEEEDEVVVGGIFGSAGLGPFPLLTPLLKKSFLIRSTLVVPSKNSIKPDFGPAKRI